MAIDPSSPARPIEADPGPVIENELLAYRALSPMAICSVLLALAAPLTFVNGWFALFGALAVLAGVAAKRKIRRVPDVLTGERFADVGIALGLLFSLSALTMGAVQDFLIMRSATRFARQFAEVLRNGSVDENLFYQASPPGRAGKTPKQVADEYAKSSPNPAAFEQQIRPLRDLKARLASTPGQALSFFQIPGVIANGMDLTAGMIYLIKGPTSQAFPEETQYAMVQIKGRTDVAGNAWTVGETVFPLKKLPGAP